MSSPAPEILAPPSPQAASPAPVNRRLYAPLWPYRREVALGALFLLLGVAAELYPPLVWGRVVNQGLTRRDWNYVAGQLLLVGVFAAQQVFSEVQGVLLERVGQRGKAAFQGCGLPCWPAPRKPRSDRHNGGA